MCPDYTLAEPPPPDPETYATASVRSVSTLLLLAALVVAIGCSSEGSPDASGGGTASSTVLSDTPDGIEHCLVEGRSLNFEAAVLELIHRSVDGPIDASLEPGLARVRPAGEVTYRYEAEYLVTFWSGGKKVGELRRYYEGTIGSRTCTAFGIAALDNLP